ncbi:Putative protein ygiD [Mariniradius saccharolyticus AK6]|uniref:Extradiol ring-cleavage dioxygenase class III enzyme subunit B domain-containing protein n=1 Tax=Mariniradius saccharolyticus AK6 TaxID=1239962 RepID=M7Y3L9_9BACT|nr:4,5-DOPA dioxygenase extradiol [Mariniradius saccharolyticus]EMS35327.1 Putative protein ygiD [Mariniradius saccharolyticus AK6]
MANSLHSLYNWSLDQLSQDLMPTLFVGHGSPMNGIENNEFSLQWQQLGKTLPRPKAILVVSAHWLTRGTHVTAMDFPETIHDFGGFPKALHEVQYPAPGEPTLANWMQEHFSNPSIHTDHEWGLDHGAWTVVRHMYPDARIPVLQLSIDYHQSPAFHYELGRQLGILRRKGVLVIGSGNMVHNLRMVAWDKLAQPGFGYDWAIEMNAFFKARIADKRHEDLLDLEKMGNAGRLAIPTPDHYNPLLYILGMQGSADQVSIFNDRLVGGSLTMTSVLMS